MLTLAAAQTVPLAGNVDVNLSDHLHFVGQAAEQGADLILFPELSLTGYEPELAADLAFVDNDPRLAPLQAAAHVHAITVVAGAPLRLGDQLHIAAFIFSPGQPVQVYLKHFLHPGEDRYFSPGRSKAICRCKGQKLFLAVCADISHPEHAVRASREGGDVFLASVFITPSGYEVDADLLQGYAKRHRFPVLMANYGGPSGTFSSGGRSAFWDEDGRLVQALPREGAGLLIARPSDGYWKGETYPGRA